MDTKSFPQEAGVDERAVHYSKGCYVGQEAMAKIHFRGKPNKRLARIAASQSLTPGAELHREGTRVGKVTSVANGNALAIVRFDVEAGTTLDSDGTTVEVVG